MGRTSGQVRYQLPLLTARAAVVGECDAVYHAKCLGLTPEYPRREEAGTVGSWVNTCVQGRREGGRVRG